MSMTTRRSAQTILSDSLKSKHLNKQNLLRNFIFPSLMWVAMSLLVMEGGRQQRFNAQKQTTFTATVYKEGTVNMAFTMKTSTLSTPS